MLIDEQDAALIGSRKADDPALEVAPILMRTPEDRRRLAAVCLSLLGRASLRRASLRRAPLRDTPRLP
jgi:hypothetical protein